MPRLSGPKRREKQNKIRGKNANASDIRSIKITSNKDKSKVVDVSTSTINLRYYESILQDSIHASVAFVDAGNSVKSGKTKKSVVEGLPLENSENVLLEFIDNNDEKIKLTMYVNDHDISSSETTKELVKLELCSKEFILNEKKRIPERFDGPISEHVKLILTDKKYLGSEKDIDIEDTQGEFTHYGKKQKCFYNLNILAQKSVPEGAPTGNSAGFFFFETSEGFVFKSIESFFGQEPKKRYIYNQTPDQGGSSVPEGYDGKALLYEYTSKSNVQKKMMMGAKKTRLITYDPKTGEYIQEIIDSDSTKTKQGGKEIPKDNPEFDTEGDEDFSRTVYQIKDTGTSPSGSGTGKSQEQLKKSSEENLKSQLVVNQSIMRYNQLFASETTILIPGDFTLHAGDAVWVDASSKEMEVCADQIDKEKGGLYVISDLCHYLSEKETYTKINLIRDSTGRDTSKNKRAITSDNSKPAKSETSPDVQSSWSKRRNARKVMQDTFLPNIK